MPEQPRDRELDLIVSTWARESERYIAEIAFLKAEVKGLVAAIHGATSKKPLVAVADATMERIQERANEEERKQLRAELATRNAAVGST